MMQIYWKFQHYKKALADRPRKSNKVITSKTVLFSPAKLKSSKFWKKGYRISFKFVFYIFKSVKALFIYKIALWIHCNDSFFQILFEFDMVGEKTKWYSWSNHLFIPSSAINQRLLVRITQIIPDKGALFANWDLAL